jgi:cardiolipin synthase A/B
MGPIYSLMSSARHSLDMTMYELSDPETDSILEADAARGVTVRVLLDQDYAGYGVNAAAYAALGAHRVDVHWAPAGTIFHQKTITIDDRTSAIMTLNLTSQYYSSTRDFAVITTDSADVAAIEQVFEQDWTSSGPPAQGPPATNLVWSPGAEGAIVGLINSARRSLLIENEEMDDYSVTDALEAAARRGVDVEVVMTYSSDWAGAFGELTAAGVKVRTYAGNASLYIHAKVIVADGATAYVGSQNFSVSSLDYNRELGIITGLPGLVRPIEATVSADFSGATPFGG